MKIKVLLTAIVFTLVFMLANVGVYANEVSFMLDIENIVSGDQPTQIENFNFKLESNTSTSLYNQQITISGEGKATFAPMIFAKTGEYNYSVSQIAGDNEYYDYCDTVYDLTVYVTKDKNSKLNVVMLTAKNHETGKKVDKIIFENRYTAPYVPPVVSPTLPAPETGDTSKLWIPITLIVVSIIALILLLIVKKKK